ncbi:hypothetical protein DM50_3094 [Burkholderia mallei]|nr:hypothetical protein DM75_3311 [Burkholderia mallei]KGU82017.1 hypothetical protein Y038_6050 [Burkholderia pseudomallei MSHR543]KOS76271.1 hypothetical protein DM46_2163 [Burkholderia mallei]KOS93463.1 hypothetical protein DM45_3249 [Burkholderia mallei]KOT01543.1 hypothetical protein DM50_3094 [Burkholderia mallei]
MFYVGAAACRHAAIFFTIRARLRCGAKRGRCRVACADGVVEPRIDGRSRFARFSGVFCFVKFRGASCTQGILSPNIACR